MALFVRSLKHVVTLAVFGAGLVFGSLSALAIEIQRIETPGGIEAWLVEEHAVPLVTMSVGFKAGSFDDPKGKEGLASMVSSLLDEGAGDMDSLAFQKRLEEKAIRMGFSADRDSFSASLNTLSKNRDDAFELFRLALTQPRFDDEAVERIRDQILVAHEQQEEDPQTISRRTWYETVFGDHPYARRSLGTGDSIKSITQTDLRSFLKSKIARDRMFVAVVGDIDSETLSKLLDKTFADLPAGSDPVPEEKIEIENSGTVTVVDRDIPQSVMIFGSKGVLRDDPDFMPAYVMNYVLGGGGFASRLMEEVREKRGLTYGIYTYLVPLDRSGLYMGQVSTENAKAGETLSLVRAEFKKLRENGITEEELKNAKTYLTGSYPLRFDSNTKIASQLVAIQLEELGIDYIDKRNDMINAVTLDDIKRVAERLLDPDNMIISIVGKPENIDG